MKQAILVISLAIFATATGCSNAIGKASVNPAEFEPDYGPGFFDEKGIDTTLEDAEGGEVNGELPPPEYIEEEILNKGGVSAFVSFPQTSWNECSDKVTGQYLTYACAKSRQISVILDSYLEQRLAACVNDGMKAQSGGGMAKSIHLVHAGVTADPRHSPKSLHSYNRAIDIKAIRAQLTSGEVRTYTYSKTGNRTFYTALRKCWGNTVHKYNGCPLYSGNPMLTGSIGWENSQHGLHMHLSVPYCLSSGYGPGVWVR